MLAPFPILAPFPTHPPTLAEELEGRCRPYGTLGFVKIRKPEVLDPLIAFNPRFMTWVGHRWYGLVEYSSSEEAHRARAALDSTDSW